MPSNLFQKIEDKEYFKTLNQPNTIQEKVYTPVSPMNRDAKILCRIL